MTTRRIAAGAILLCCSLTSQQASAKGTRDAAALAKMSELAAGRQGTVCWQSRDKGPLRIVCSNLDGENFRQVSDDVEVGDQLGPLISPDGKRVIYYQSQVALDDTNYYSDHVGDMMMATLDGSAKPKQLVANVRTYYECRFARWIDNDQIAYIGSDHSSSVYSLSKGTSSKLFAYPNAEFGAIPNHQLTYAIDGSNRVFSIGNPGASGTLTQKNKFDGCEGNLSNNGQWAYRVRGENHDFVRMRLGSWQEEAFFANYDPALPADQHYIYFPQISPCQRFLALGVSKDSTTHDHWESDYDIFVVEIDPASFKMKGSPVKYSFSTAMESYPDIWVAPDRPPQVPDSGVLPEAGSVSSPEGGAEFGTGADGATSSAKKMAGLNGGCSLAGASAGSEPLLGLLIALAVLVLLRRRQATRES